MIALRRLTSIAVLVTLSIVLAFPALAHANHENHSNTPTSFVTYWTAYNPGFQRSHSPYDLTPPPADHLKESVGEEGSITLSITDNSGKYYDLGFYWDTTSTAGNLAAKGLTATGTGPFAANVWFDVDNDGEFFVWASNNYVAEGPADNYGLGPNNDGGTGFTVSGSSNLYLTGTNWGSCSAQTQTLSYIIANHCGGVTSSTHVAVWLGITNGPMGSITKATITSISTALAECQEGDGNGNFQGQQQGNFNMDNDGCMDGDQNQVSSDNVGDGKNFQSTSISTASFDAIAHTVTITGLGTHGGVPVNFTFVALETGPTTPGWVSFTFSDGYTNAGTLTSGSIILH